MLAEEGDDACGGLYRSQPCCWVVGQEKTPSGWGCMYVSFLTNEKNATALLTPNRARTYLINNRYNISSSSPTSKDGPNQHTRPAEDGWYRRVEERAAAFTRMWHERERSRKRAGSSAKRECSVVTATRAVDTTNQCAETRGGGCSSTTPSKNNDAGWSLS